MACCKDKQYFKVTTSLKIITEKLSTKYLVKQILENFIPSRISHVTVLIHKVGLLRLTTCVQPSLYSHTCVCNISTDPSRMYNTRSDASSAVVSRQQSISDTYDQLMKLAKVRTYVHGFVIVSVFTMHVCLCMCM